MCTFAPFLGALGARKYHIGIPAAAPGDRMMEEGQGNLAKPAPFVPLGRPTPPSPRFVAASILAP
eukprot:1603023-Pyramimonas_sp.AAC.1